jgi:hypothetical protein
MINTIAPLKPPNPLLAVISDFLFFFVYVPCVPIIVVSIHTRFSGIDLRYVLDMFPSGGTPKRTDFPIVYLLLLTRLVRLLHTAAILAHLVSTPLQYLPKHMNPPVCIL